jgi:hypothetical protein
MIFLQRNGFFAFFQRLTSLFVIPHLFLVALGILLVLLFFLITANVLQQRRQRLLLRLDDVAFVVGLFYFFIGIT